MSCPICVQVRDTLQNLLALLPPDHTIAAIPSSGITIEAIQRGVAAYFEVKLYDLRGPKRHQFAAQPRMIAMFLSRKLTAASYHEIGSYFSGRDHSTVISAVRKIKHLCGEDADLHSVVNTIERRLVP